MWFGVGAARSTRREAEAKGGGDAAPPPPPVVAAAAPDELNPPRREVPSPLSLIEADVFSLWGERTRVGGGARVTGSCHGAPAVESRSSASSSATGDGGRRRDGETEPPSRAVRADASAVTFGDMVATATAWAGAAEDVDEVDVDRARPGAEGEDAAAGCVLAAAGNAIRTVDDEPPTDEVDSDLKRPESTAATPNALPAGGSSGVLLLPLTAADGVEPATALKDGDDRTECS